MKHFCWPWTCALMVVPLPRATLHWLTFAYGGTTAPSNLTSVHDLTWEPDSLGSGAHALLCKCAAVPQHRCHLIADVQ